MAGLSTPILLAVFVLASVATWIAGVVLSGTTDELDNRLGLGAALGGMILLAIAGSLPEIAITVTAAGQGHLGLADAADMERFVPTWQATLTVSLLATAGMPAARADLVRAECAHAAVESVLREAAKHPA